MFCKKCLNGADKWHKYVTMHKCHFFGTNLFHFLPIVMCEKTQDTSVCKQENNCSVKNEILHEHSYASKVLIFMNECVVLK